RSAEPGRSAAGRARRTPFTAGFLQQSARVVIVSGRWALPVDLSQAHERRRERDLAHERDLGRGARAQPPKHGVVGLVQLAARLPSRTPALQATRPKSPGA